MSNFEMRRRPRQLPGPLNPFSPPSPFIPGGLPSNLIVPPPPPTNPAATIPLTSGFFQPPAPAETPAAAAPSPEPQLTLTASDPPAATEAPVPVVFPDVPPAPAPANDFIDGDFSISVQPENSLGSVVDGVGSPTQASPEVVVTGGDSATVGGAATASTPTGGIAFGSIAGIAFLVSIIFLFYKWRKGTLPQSVNRLALKFRPNSPDADHMEKGLTRSDSVSIRTATTTATSYSKAISSIKAFIRPSTSSSETSSRAEQGISDHMPSISAPTAYNGPQADKLAVPLPLHLAKLQAAGLWTADGSETVNTAATAAAVTTGPMNPKPVVAEPLVHPLRAHKVEPQEGVAEVKPASWPL